MGSFCSNRRRFQHLLAFQLEYDRLQCKRVKPGNLTVDLGKSMDIGGFKFQQRPSTNNGIVYQYSYRILDENDQVIESGDHITVPSNLRAGAAWVSTQFDTTAKNARKIQILVEEGQGGFAAISEVVPFTVQK